MSERPITIVTGASQGIGRELAIAFAEKGNAVVLAARNEPNLEETASMVTAAGGEPFVIPTDVTDVASVDAMAEATLGRFGRVDVLVNNSAIGGPSGRLWELDPGDWQATFDVNVAGVFLVSRAVLPSMLENGSGSVIIIGSVSGKRPLFGRSAYASTKMALVGLTRTLAVETGPHGVRVNLISPGFVSGPRFEWLSAAQASERGIDEDTVKGEFLTQAALNRLTEARDVADAAVFLASDSARGITGTDLNVNSGIVMY